MLEGEGVYCFLGTDSEVQLNDYPPYRQVLKYEGEFKNNRFNGKGKIL